MLVGLLWGFETDINRVLEERGREVLEERGREDGLGAGEGAGEGEGCLVGFLGLAP